MDLPLPPLRASVDRLESAVRRLDDAHLRGPSYCSGWTVAQVLSHLGSAGTIMLRNVADALGGTTTPDDFTQSVWDEWNAKAPRAQAVDSLAVDALAAGRVGGRQPGGPGPVHHRPRPRQPQPRRGHRPARQRAHVPHLGHRGHVVPGGHPSAGRDGVRDRQPGDDCGLRGPANGRGARPLRPHECSRAAISPCGCPRTPPSWRPGPQATLM